MPCLAFARSWTFGLGIASKEQLSSFRSRIRFALEIMVMLAIDVRGKEPLVGLDIQDYVKVYNFNLHDCF